MAKTGEKIRNGFTSLRVALANEHNTYDFKAYWKLDYIVFFNIN